MSQSPANIKDALNTLMDTLNTYAVVKCKSAAELALRHIILTGHQENLSVTLPAGRDRDILSMKYLVGIYTMLNASPELVPYEIAESAFRLKNREIAYIEKSEYNDPIFADPVFANQKNELTTIFETFTEIYANKYLFRNPIPLK